MKKFILAAVTSIPALFASAGGLAVLGTTSLVALESFAEASPVRGSSLTSMNNPAGRRGQIVSWRVRLTANGRPVANTPLAVTWRSDARSDRALSPACTDAQGYATITFCIPTNVNDDNVILTAISGGGPFTTRLSQRVAIGR